MDVDERTSPAGKVAGSKRRSDDPHEAREKTAEVRAADSRIRAQLKNEDGESVGPPLELPADITPKQLQMICNKILSELSSQMQQEEEYEDTPYAFFVNEQEVVDTLADVVDEQNLTSEQVVDVVYQPQAMFRVRGISQCSASIPGHADNIVDCFFSPDGRHLATGSGDMTVRFWDVNTLTPKMTCKGHKHWVQCISWSPDGLTLASGGADKEIRLWDPITGKELCKPLTAHTNYITWIAWEPLHLAPTEKATRFVSASKDGTAKVWDMSKASMLQLTLAQHTKGVTCVKWGGEGLIYTASQDTNIRVWRSEDGALCRQLQGHAHWVNNIAISTDYALRTGPFDEHGNKPEGDPREAARVKYEKARGECERLVSASEDNTLFLWHPTKDKKPLVRMTGHQRAVNFAAFSPDGRLIVSCSFDKSAKLWDGKTGKFIGTFRAHVGPVFRATWSGDSRLLITGSEDSTMKLWTVKTQKLLKDLPGHAGSVFAVDWAPNGELVASGGADKTLKIWRH